MWFRRPNVDQREVLPPAFDLDVVIISDVGRRRAQNEDSGLNIRPGDSDVFNRKGILTLVADGMGGHIGGAVASRTAVETISRTYYASTRRPPEALREAFAEANRAILEKATVQVDLAGMGTTCVALLVVNDEAWFAHVGDSRIYHLRNDIITQLTTDHSVVAEMIEEGLITPGQARYHEARNVITRALGTQVNVEPTVTEKAFPIEVEDVFLLTSDGLYDLVEEEEVIRVISEQDLNSAAEELIRMANQRGGYDNITVALARVIHPLKVESQERATRELPALS